MQNRGSFGWFGDAVEVTVILLVVTGVFVFFGLIYLRTQLVADVTRLVRPGGRGAG